MTTNNVQPVAPRRTVAKPPPREFIPADGPAVLSYLKEHPGAVQQCAMDMNIKMGGIQAFLAAQEGASSEAASIEEALAEGADQKSEISDDFPEPGERPATSSTAAPAATPPTSTAAPSSAPASTTAAPSSVPAAATAAQPPKTRGRPPKHAAPETKQVAAPEPPTDDELGDIGSMVLDCRKRGVTLEQHAEDTALEARLLRKLGFTI